MRERTGPVRHFLVTKRFGKLERIDVFDNADEAMRAYEQKERECGWANHPRLANVSADCVLLGADRLSTCIATHGNWFDEPSGLDRLLEDTVPKGEDPGA